MYAVLSQVHTWLPSWLRGREGRKAENQVQDLQVILGLDNRAKVVKRLKWFLKLKHMNLKKETLIK